MKFTRPKLIGTLKVKVMMAGNLAIINDIKNAPNKIIIQCDSMEQGEEIIEKLKAAKFGEVINF